MRHPVLSPQQFRPVYGYLQAVPQSAAPSIAADFILVRVPLLPGEYGLLGILAP